MRMKRCFIGCYQNVRRSKLTSDLDADILSYSCLDQPSMIENFTNSQILNTGNKEIDWCLSIKIIFLIINYHEAKVMEIAYL